MEGRGADVSPWNFATTQVPAEEDTAKLRIWTLRFWVFLAQAPTSYGLDVMDLGFRGPGLPSARQMLCGDAPRLFSIILVCI